MTLQREVPEHGASFFLFLSTACNAVEIIIKPLCTNQSKYPANFSLSSWNGGIFSRNELRISFLIKFSLTFALA